MLTALYLVQLAQLDNDMTKTQLTQLAEPEKVEIQLCEGAQVDILAASTFASW